MGRVIHGPGACESNMELEPLEAPIGERVLWRGQSDPHHLRRGMLRDAATSLLGQAGTVAVILVIIAGTGSDVLFFAPWIIGFIIIFGALPGLWSGVRDYRGATKRRYLLTEDRLLIRGGGAPVNVRLVNLPDLRLKGEGNGIGSIMFTEPVGGGPERMIRAISRFVPGSTDPTLLLESIPDAARVLKLMLSAQAAAGTGHQPADAEADETAHDPVTGRPMPAADATVATRAPIAHQDLARSMSTTPPWVGGLMLAIGIAALVLLGFREEGEAALIGIGVGAIFVLMGTLMLAGQLVWRRAQARLNASGVETRARVLDVASTGITDDDEEQWVVRFEFTVLGVPHRGQSTLMPWAQAARYAPGDQVTARYNPDNPENSVLVAP